MGLQQQLIDSDGRGKQQLAQEIEFVDALPMTTTGKVQRRILRLQEEARAAQRS